VALAHKYEEYLTKPMIPPLLLGGAVSDRYWGTMKELPPTPIPLRIRPAMKTPWFPSDAICMMTPMSKTRPARMSAMRRPNRSLNQYRKMTPKNAPPWTAMFSSAAVDPRKARFLTGCETVGLQRYGSRFVKTEASEKRRQRKHARDKCEIVAKYDAASRRNDAQYKEMPIPYFSRGDGSVDSTGLELHIDDARTCDTNWRDLSTLKRIGEEDSCRTEAIHVLWRPDQHPVSARSRC
jgi:hypothetical protein